MLAALALLFGLVLYAQAHGGYLSNESRQYQQIVWETMSGLSLWYFVQRVCWLFGVVSGAVAIVLLFFRIRAGVIFLFWCAPVLLIAAISGAPPSAFPDIERLPVVLLECVTSAMWGCVVAYVLTAQTVLFSKPTGETNPSAAAALGGSAV